MRKQEAIMSTKISRLATGVFAVLMGVAVLGVGTAWADEYTEDLDGPVSTGCGGGANVLCAQKPITECDWEFSLQLNPQSKNFGITIKKSNCVVTGHTPQYKDLSEAQLHERTCAMLSPLEGMPKAPTCSD
jgi:hypothetical protein